MSIYIGNRKAKLYIGNKKVKKAYLGNRLVYSAGNVVTYKIDTNVTYTEEMDEGESCLSAKTFTPTKSGWEFVGWRTDSTASGSVLSSKVMGDNPITLYAVFRQTITVTYYNNSTTKSTTNGYRYYNNSNIVNPTFTLTQASRSGWTVRGWSTSTAGNGAISYNNATAFTRDSNVTLYGMYQQTITVTYYNGTATAASTSGTRYYNSGKDVTTNPTFSLTPVSKSGWTFRGWATSSAAAANIEYNSISGTAFSANATVYAAYYQTITLSYNGNNNTSGSTAAQTGTRYWNTGNVSNPSFSLSANGFSKSGYTFSKWALGSAGGTQYDAGASVTLSANTTMYAVWTASPLYVIQNGSLVSGNYIEASRNYYAQAGYGGDDRDYGCYRHSNGNGDDIGPRIRFNTKDLTKVDIIVEGFVNGGLGRRNPYLSIYDESTESYITNTVATKLMEKDSQEVVTETFTEITVPSNTNLTLYFHIANGTGTNYWADLTIKSIYLHS